MRTPAALIGFSILCVLCAIGLGLVARDVALEVTHAPERARAIGFAATAAVLAGFALLVLVMRWRRRGDPPAA